MFVLPISLAVPFCFKGEAVSASSGGPTLDLAHSLWLTTAPLNLWLVTAPLKIE